MSKHRATQLSVPDMYRLNVACRHVAAAFDDNLPYLVGSSLTKKNYRDVDLRLMLDDDEFARLFPNPMWLKLANAAMSDWLASITGLPIDFQFQDTTQANKEFTGRRHPLGFPMALAKGGA